VTIHPNIGLDAAARQSVVEILNILLADEAVLSMKTRRADEQVNRTGIPDLHPLYEAQSQQINNLVTDMVERVSILGGSHPGDTEEIIDSARLVGKFSVAPGVMGLLADHEAFIRFLREDAQKCSEMYEDQGTYALLVSVMRTHEKMAWMLRSNIAVEQFPNEIGG